MTNPQATCLDPALQLMLYSTNLTEAQAAMRLGEMDAVLRSLQRCRALKSVQVCVTDGALLPACASRFCCGVHHPQLNPPAACSYKGLSACCSPATPRDYQPAASHPHLADARLSVPVASLMAYLPRWCPAAQLEVIPYMDLDLGGMPEEELEALLLASST